MIKVMCIQLSIDLMVATLCLHKQGSLLNEMGSLQLWERVRTFIILKLVLCAISPTKPFLWYYNCDKLSCLDQFTLLFDKHKKKLVL